MKIRLLCVGDVRGPLRTAIEEFEARVGRYWRFDVVEVQAGIGKGRKGDGAKVRDAEGERLLTHLAKDAGEVVSLTRGGKAISSRGLADYLAEKALRSAPQVTFVIGGAFGLGESVVARSDLRVSLSGMTLPHEIARLFLTEQLYRAGTILRNEPYHKGP